MMISHFLEDICGHQPLLRVICGDQPFLLWWESATFEGYIW